MGGRASHVAARPRHGADGVTARDACVGGVPYTDIGHLRMLIKYDVQSCDAFEAGQSRTGRSCDHRTGEPKVHVGTALTLVGETSTRGAVP